MEMFFYLTIMPFIFGAIVTISNSYRLISIVAVGFLSIVSIYGFFNPEAISFSIETPTHHILQILDFILISYFLYQGFKYRDFKTKIFALTQLALYTVVISTTAESSSFDILFDSLSYFMFILINIVGGLIVIYALGYIEYEDFSIEKKRAFIGILLAFLGVMNAIVVTNSLEIFFLLFETTTLASYLLIRYRMDDISIKNGIKALYMNQVGGVALLVGMVILNLNEDSIYFSEIISNQNIIFLPFAILALAGLIKGAQTPFDGWLLGAMVAPTPVSAILHSSTMVKIAPFLIIKLSPILSQSLAGKIVAIFSGFVFISSGLSALYKSNFKEILAHSTISLLGLMIALAAVGTNLTIIASIMLLFFHGVSKAMLFLQAGILEKIYHLKDINDMDSLLSKAPLTTLFILFGFISISLPPFGAFFGKFLAIEGLASEILLVTMMAIGGVVLVLLYLKVSAKLLIKQRESLIKESVPNYMFTPNLFLTLILITTGFFIAPFISNIVAPIAMEITQTSLSISSNSLGLTLKFTEIEFWEIAIGSLILISIPALTLVKLPNIDRVKEYNCAESVNIEIKSYFFKMPTKLFNTIGAIFFVLIILGGFYV